MDIVERLRQISGDDYYFTIVSSDQRTFIAAAAEIERLRAENDGLRKAVQCV